MTEAGWTRNADVKESGFYWLVWAERLPQVVQVREASVHFTSGLTISLEEVNGQFLGPITPDSYQQGRVAGLVRGAQLVRWHKSCAFEAAPAFALERAAKDIESVASQIIQPQQAQEGGVGDGGKTER